MNILVTGGAGYIGSICVEKLLASHLGAHPTTAYRGQHGTFIMTRQDTQSRSRYDDPRGCYAHSK